MRGVKLDKLKGAIQAGKFDKNRGRIEELLEAGLSVRKISKMTMKALRIVCSSVIGLALT